MTTDRQARSKTQTSKPGKAGSKAKQPVQKDPQVAQQKTIDSFIENKKKLQEETQNFMYSQSSKFSTVSRALIFGIIGTIWVLTYTDGNLHIPNRWLFVCILLGLFYLFGDVCHYFSDSMSYYKEADQFIKYKSQDDLDNKHEPEMDSISHRSHVFLIFKFIILLIVAILFVIGLIIRTKL